MQFRRSRTGKAETVWRFAQFFRGRRQVLRQRCAGRESRTAPVHCAYEQLSFINAACSSSLAFLLHYCIHQPNSPSKPHQLNPQHPTQQHYHINNRRNAFHRIVSASLLLLRRACRNPRGRRQSQHRYRNTQANALSSDIIKIICAVVLPPLGVFLERGCGADLLINLLLTILGCKYTLQDHPPNCLSVT